MGAPSGIINRVVRVTRLLWSGNVRDDVMMVGDWEMLEGVGIGVMWTQAVFKVMRASAQGAWCVPSLAGWGKEGM